MPQEVAIERVLGPIRMCCAQPGAEEGPCCQAHLHGQLEARDWRESAEDLRLNLGCLGEGIGAIARKGHQGLVERNASQSTDMEPKVPFRGCCCRSAGLSAADTGFFTQKGAITIERMFILLDQDGQIERMRET